MNTSYHPGDYVCISSSYFMLKFAHLFQCSVCVRIFGDFVEMHLGCNEIIVDNLYQTTNFEKFHVTVTGVESV